MDTGGIEQRHQILKLLLYHNCRDVAEHLELEKVNIKIFMVEWFMTL